jgi:hypothetical protein
VFQRETLREQLPSSVSRLVPFSHDSSSVAIRIGIAVISVDQF